MHLSPDRRHSRQARKLLYGDIMILKQQKPLSDAVGCHRLSQTALVGMCDFNLFLCFLMRSFSPAESIGETDVDDL